MADDTVPMPTIFPACRKVAEEMMMPLHYTKLTLRALERLHISVSSLNLKRQREDVREKLLKKGGYGFGYIGSPSCLAYLKEWLAQETMLNPCPPVVIRITACASLEAAFQGRMRKYIDKTNAPKEIIEGARIRGLFIEHQVRFWFKSRWAEMVLPPDNEGKWDVPCSHDFKLKVDGHTFLVDIAGPKRNGVYGKPAGGGKQATDIHILASVDKDDVLMHGFITRGEFKDALFEWESHPIARMVFWLNCNKLGIDYGLFSQKSWSNPCRLCTD